MNDKYTTPLSLLDVKNALLDESKIFPVTFLQFFSDIEPDNLAGLKEFWPLVSDNRKVALLQELEESLETDTLVNYEDFAFLAVKDPIPTIREQAIRLFWDSDNYRIIPLLIETMETDSDSNVKAAAAEILGHFELLAVLEEIPQKYLPRIENALWKAYQSGEKNNLTLRALESLGYSEDERVPEIIRSAFTSDDTNSIASALLAMGRSVDNRWKQQILNSLDNEEFLVRIAAIRAAGELELKESRVPLVNIIADEKNDADLRYAAIWALSNIGGKEIKQYLEQRLEESVDEEEAEVLEEAIENMALMDDVSFLDFNELR